MATTSSKVLFCYVPSGKTKPSPADSNTIYFLVDAKEIHVGDQVIAQNVEGQIPTVVLTGDTTNGNFISNVSYNSSTHVITVTKSLLTINKQSSPDSGYAATYQMFMDSTAVGAKINIPKDMVVESGSMVDITYSNNKLWDDDVDVTEIIKGEGGTATAADAGPYIRLIIANTSEDRIYIKVAELVGTYTGGQTAEATVNIDNNNVITVIINKIDAGKIIYQVAAPATYDQVTSGDTFDPNETYYTKSGDTYTVDSTVTADNFAAKVAEGLYTEATPAVAEQTIKDKVDEIASDITTDIAAAISSLDATEVGGSGKYLTTISETDGVISATAATADTTVTSASNNLVTSGAVYTAVSDATPTWEVVTT